MKNLVEIRKRNLISLIKEYGQKELARKIGRSDALLNSYKSDTVKKNIGEKFARHVEEKLRLEEGWLDQDHGDHGATNGDYNLSEHELLKAISKNQGYSGQYKHLIKAEEEGRLEPSEKAILEALNSKYKE